MQIQDHWFLFCSLYLAAYIAVDLPGDVGEPGLCPWRLRQHLAQHIGFLVLPHLHQIVNIAHQIPKIPSKHFLHIVLGWLADPPEIFDQCINRNSGCLDQRVDFIHVGEFCRLQHLHQVLGLQLVKVRRVLTKDCIPEYILHFIFMGFITMVRQTQTQTTYRENALCIVF